MTEREALLDAAANAAHARGGGQPTRVDQAQLEALTREAQEPAGCGMTGMDGYYFCTRCDFETSDSQAGCRLDSTQPGGDEILRGQREGFWK
jgi:hypothetical protein